MIDPFVTINKTFNTYTSVVDKAQLHLLFRALRKYNQLLRMYTITHTSHGAKVTITIEQLNHAVGYHHITHKQ